MCASNHGDHRSTHHVFQRLPPPCLLPRPTLVRARGPDVLVRTVDRTQDEMRREVQTMRMMSHPNLVDILCCFVSQQELWLVMRYLAGGSALNLLKWEHQKGFDEPTIATIAKSVLQALAYCHKNQLIHRDIKSGNILLDTDGSVRNQPPSVCLRSSHSPPSLRAHSAALGGTTPCQPPPLRCALSTLSALHALSPARLG